MNSEKKNLKKNTFIAVYQLVRFIVKKVGKKERKEERKNLRTEESIKVIPWFCAAHNIATSKGAVIFTCRLKRGNYMYGPFCSLPGLKS